MLYLLQNTSLAWEDEFILCGLLVGVGVLPSVTGQCK